MIFCLEFKHTLLIFNVQKPCMLDLFVDPLFELVIKSSESSTFKLMRAVLCSCLGLICNLGFVFFGHGLRSLRSSGFVEVFLILNDHIKML